MFSDAAGSLSLQRPRVVPGSDNEKLLVDVDVGVRGLPAGEVKVVGPK